MEKVSAHTPPIPATSRPRWSRLWRTLPVVALSACYFLYVSGYHSLGALLAKHDPVEQVLRLQPLTDGHNDFPIFIRYFYHNHIYQSNFSADIPLPGQVDFPRLAQGRVRGQFWSVYVGCEGNEQTFVPETLQQIDLVHRLATAYPSHISLSRDTTAFYHTFHHHRTQIASFLGVEGLHQISGSAATLRLYHALGVRYTTLTHTCHNAYADSASPAQPLHGGLSAKGREMVREMNRLGMAVDLAHVSVATMHDALDVSRAPVMFSHSSVYALCEHVRNVPDEVLHRVKENGGVVMVTFFPEYTRCDDGAVATLADVADHIQYVGRLIGYEYVGLGSDFDGMMDVVQGLEDVSRYPDLIRELLRRGVSVKEMAGVVGGNVLRVMRGVERVARQMQAEGVRPLEDEVDVGGFELD